MRRYGNHMTLLDATYATTRFSLPLFFLAVKTNANYQVVAMFMLEDENTVSIGEALQIIKNANPEWEPKYYITDLDEREISAMSSLFPGE